MIKMFADGMLPMTGGWVYRQEALVDEGGYQDVATPKVYIYPKCYPASIDLPEEVQVTAGVKKTVLMAATCEDSV